MRQCLRRRLCLRPLQQWMVARTGGSYVRAPRHFTAGLSTYTGNKADKIRASASKRDVLHWTNPLNNEEKHNVASWASLLENALPPHLRENTETHSGPGLNTRHVAEIILAARRVNTGSLKDLDVLFHLGVEKDRWRVVVWLVKQLLDTFAPIFREIGRIPKPPGSWMAMRSLSKLTTKPINPRELSSHAFDGHISSKFYKLDEITDDLKAKKLSHEYSLCQRVLGSIWQSLGKMTIACADRDIQPEILEIIAYLHHMEIMPTSIYNQRPSVDRMAVQQPLMLSLFSSRILTSLSDAAWKAHEKLVVEEAKAKGMEHIPLGPEIPGTAYRVNVANLRPEVWLELILWSCLHRGWIAEGSAILRTMYAEPKPREWKPLSWRSLFKYAERDQEWEQLEYMFNTQPQSARAVHPPTSTSVRRTISSEVVNAYVDALLGTVRLSDGESGEAPNHVIARLNFLQKFLQRSGMSLETTSWDAILLRFFDYHGTVLHQKGNFNQLVGLSPSMGEELDPNNVRELPPYVLDGSAAILGLFHRAMQSTINAGDVRGALRLFESLQSLADKNKYRSVVDFFRIQQLSAKKNEDSDGSPELFTNHVSGIEYPAFNVQIPPTILGPFLELVLDAKAHDFAKWLVYSDEVDGPVIPERLYGDPAIAPALVRLAAEMDDTKLFSKLVEARSMQQQDGEERLPRKILQSFFEIQVLRKRWDAAERVLQHIKDTRNSYWNSISIASVIRMMLMQIRGADSGNEAAVLDLDRAKTLLSDMIQGKHERQGERNQRTENEIALFLIMLSTLNRSWAEYCLTLQSLSGLYTFKMSTKAFNLVLEGVVDAYGSIAGQQLLDIFWSRALRKAQRLAYRRHEQSSGKRLTFRYVTDVLDEPERIRTEVDIPGHPLEKVVIYEGLSPDYTTILTVFRKAIEELKQRQDLDDKDVDGRRHPSPLVSESRITDTGNVDVSTFRTILWAVKCLRSLDMLDQDIRDELNQALPENEHGQLKDRLLDLLEKAGRGNSTNVSVAHEEDLHVPFAEVA